MIAQHNSKQPYDFEQLLHPAQAFDHPMDIVRDPDLTRNEKRAILSSWASDACAVEAANELRLAAFGATARWDDIMDALRALDGESGPTRPIYDPKRPWWHQPRIASQPLGEQRRDAR